MDNININDIKTIEDVRSYIDSTIMSYLPDPKQHPSQIPEAMQYAMTAGGKKIRPTLMLLSYLALCDSKAGSEIARNPKVINPFLAAVEMIHTYSLIHDDLPAIDNDSLRRGRPTVHVEYDECTAILTGDALLNFAYETACGNPDDFDTLEEMRRHYKALSILLVKAGITGMIGGQGLDVQLSGLTMNDEQREYIYKNKTCALIEAPIMMGAVLAGADEAMISKLEKAGEDFGLAFQVQDDVLDVIGEEETVGKEIHQDERNEKNTYVAMYGLDAAKEYVRKMSENAIELIEEALPDNNMRTVLTTLVKDMISREV